MADPRREGGAAALAFCWAHLRRRFYDISKGGAAPLAEEALEVATTAPAAGLGRGLPVDAAGGRVSPFGIARRTAERSQLPV
jgi:hypothetical protein